MRPSLGFHDASCSAAAAPPPNGRIASPSLRIVDGSVLLIPRGSTTFFCFYKTSLQFRAPEWTLIPPGRPLGWDGDSQTKPSLMRPPSSLSLTTVCDKMKSFSPIVEVLAGFDVANPSQSLAIPHNNNKEDPRPPARAREVFCPIGVTFWLVCF